jgi:hypothetical protein
MQKHRAADGNWRARRARSEQPRKDAEERVVDKNDVCRKIHQYVVQAGVLFRDDVYEDTLEKPQPPFGTGRKSADIGDHRLDLAQIQIRADRKAMEARADLQHPIAHQTRSQDNDFVPLFDENPSDRE